MNIQEIRNQNIYNDAAFKTAFDNQLDLSQEIANRYLLDAPVQAEPVAPRSSGSSFTWINLGGSRTVHHYHGGHHAREKDEKMSDGTRVLAGIAGAAIMLIGSYFIGESIKQMESAKEELEQTNEFRSELKIHQDCPNKESIDTITRATNRILKRSIASAQWGLALKIALVAGAAILVAGAVLGNPVIAAVGGGIALLAGCALLVKYGIERGNRANKRDARIIENPARDQKKNLKKTETVRMESYEQAPSPAPSAPPSYDTIYPDLQKA